MSRLVAAIVLTGLVLAQPAAAQDRPRAGADRGAVNRQGEPPAVDGGRRGRAGGALRRGGAGAPSLADGTSMTAQQVEQMFDRYVLNQARVALQLTPEQLPLFRPRLERLQMVRRRTQRERQVLVNELAQLTRGGGGPISDESLAVKLKAVEEQAARSAQMIRDAYQQLDDGLSVPQRARFRVFEQRMERQKLELMARAREQVRQQPPAPAPEAPPTSPMPQ
ncbi:MAG: hypothetical protein ABI051_05690 [Vicinamibacterales bacterium]